MDSVSARYEILADSLLSAMSPEQKVGQLFMPAIFASSDTWTVSKVREYAEEMFVGGLVLLKGDSIGALEISKTLNRHSLISPFIAIDAENGLAMRLKDMPKYPPMSKLSAVSEGAMFDYGAEIASECHTVGINMILGPVLDISTPKGVMRNRSLGADPVIVSDLGIAYSMGLESGGVISVAKHFPGHGSVSMDSHLGLPVVSRSLNMLDSVDLMPFRRYINSGRSAIMVGHLAVPAVDPDMLPAAVSPAVITDLLRSDMGFDGLVLTDALNMAGAKGYGADMAFKAGSDIILAPQNTRDGINRIYNLIQSDSTAMASLDEKVRRILFYKLLFNLIPHS